MLGVESHHPPAGGAGGRLDTDAVLQRAGQQAIRIGLPQIVFAEEGEFVQVFQAMDVIGGDPFGLHLGPVIGDIVIDIAHLLNQQLTLVGPDLVLGHGFNFRLVHGHGTSVLTLSMLLCYYNNIIFLL